MSAVAAIADRETAGFHDQVEMPQNCQFLSSIESSMPHDLGAVKAALVSDEFVGGKST